MYTNSSALNKIFMASFSNFFFPSDCTAVLMHQLDGDQKGKQYMGCNLHKLEEMLFC